MAITPIDIQVNMAQMLEVGKSEHAKQGAIAEQQQLLHKESSDKSNQVGKRLEEMREGEKTAIRDEDKKGDNRERRSREKDKKESSEKPGKMIDERMGNIIDIFK